MAGQEGRRYQGTEASLAVVSFLSGPLRTSPLGFRGNFRDLTVGFVWPMGESRSDTSGVSK